MAPDTSNFCAVTAFADPLGVTGGQTCWVQLDAPEIALLQRVNRTDYGEQPWHYLVSPSKSIYLTTVNDDDDVVQPIHWPRIVIGSGAIRNVVKVLEERGGSKRIEGIPHSADYSPYSPQSHPHLFHRVYCAHGEAGKVPNVIREWPGYATYGALVMPIFDPASGYKVSAGEQGLWIPSNWLCS